MSQKANGQQMLSTAEVTDYMLNTLERGEQAEERMLDKLLEKTSKEKEEALKTLETEWPELETVWKQMIQEGDSPVKALNFLKSFA